MASTKDVDHIFSISGKATKIEEMLIIGMDYLSYQGSHALFWVFQSNLIYFK